MFMSDSTRQALQESWTKHSEASVLHLGYQTGGKSRQQSAEFYNQKGIRQRHTTALAPSLNGELKRIS